MSLLLYSMVVRLYGLGIRLSAINNSKAGQWVKGRKNWKQNLSDAIKPLSGKSIIWVHCASYGEFEQGRPLIEAIKQQQPETKIVLSFFSPSGYEAFHNWPGADVICYLPLDTKKNARDFIQILNPQLAIFIKYEFWVRFLFELKSRDIPSYLVSAVFKQHHPFFKWYGALFRKSLMSFKKLFIQDEASGKLLKSIHIHHFMVNGDTRFDRVIEVKNKFKPLDFFETYCANHIILMGGSTWPKDEAMLLNAYNKIAFPNLKLILVPHEVDVKSIKNTISLVEKAGLEYTLYSSGTPDVEKKVLIVDAMGLLSKLYHYATIAYIGGGFDSGIHNCLEPAVHLKPMLFYGGDDFHKYNEAIELIALRAAKNVNSAESLEFGINELLTNTSKIKDIEEKLKQYFEKNAGSTEKLMKELDLNA